MLSIWYMHPTPGIIVSAISLSWSRALGEPLDPKTGHSSFRRPCFQRGEVREKSQFPAGPTFPPETWQKDLIEPACLAYVPTLDTFKVGWGDIEGPARKFRTQAELSRGKNHAQKAMTTHENLLSLAADSGADTNQKHNNQPNKHFHAHLRRVSLHFWVDWAAVALTVCHFSSAALFRVLEHRLIVLICVFSHNSMPIKLKLSHA